MNIRYWKKLIGFIGLFTVFFALTALCASAETEGIFTYRVMDNNTVEVTRVNAEGLTEVSVPETLGEKPVAKVVLSGIHTSRSPLNLSLYEKVKLSLPKSVIELESTLLDARLSGIYVDEQNPVFATDEDGILFNKDGATLVLFPNGSTKTAYTIPANVTTLSSHAFYGVSTLTQIIISDSVTVIDSSCFSRCSSLNDIQLPEAMIRISNNAFDDTAFYNNESNWENGVLYCGSHLIKAKTSLSGEYTVKEGTLTIAASAFQAARSLTQVVFPDSLLYIGARAFNSCTLLNEPVLPDHLKILDNYVFTECPEITVFRIPKELEEVSVRCVNYEKMERFEVGPNNAHFSTDQNGVLFNKAQTELIAYPGRNTATSYQIPNTVRIIKKYAFYDVDYLTSVTLSNSMETIGENAFDNCGRLKHVVFPDGLKRIDDYAFINCIELEDGVFPDSVEHIGTSAFSGCVMEAVFLPASLSEIGVHPFFGCKKVRAFTVNPENPSYSCDTSGVLYNKNKTELIHYPLGNESTTFEVPLSVSTIKKGAFARCAAIKQISLHNNIEVIESEAFASCPALEVIAIPECIQNLGRLFSDDVSLKEVYLPKTVTNVQLAFLNCTSLTDICYAGTEEDWERVTKPTSETSEGKPTVVNQCTIHFNTSVNSYLNLRYENDNDILTFSGSGAILGGWHYWDADKDTVTTVLVNGDYQAIDTNAFADYPALTTVILNTDSTAIADGAFDNCPNLQAVLCFGGSSFGADAFDFDGILKVYENADAVHSMTASLENISVVPYRFSDGTLQLLADANYDSYEFFDTMAAFTLEYDDIQKLSFRRFTFDSIPMYYYPEEDGGTQRIEDNTLINGEIYPMIYVDGEATPITFNALINGLADTTISSFYLISSDENHKQIKDTQITVKDDTENENNGSGGFIGVIKKAMRWVITLLNKLFTIISKLGKK